MRAISSSSGFSLLEVMVASAVLAGAVLSVAQLFAVGTRSTADARLVGEGAALAWQKVEQLRSLAFATDEAGLPVTDLSTDTTAALEREFGGTGLSASPEDALQRDTPGYVDYLDAHGEPLGGAPLPDGARFRRRWSIEARGPDLLVVRVRVLAVGRELEAARVVSMRARKLS